MPGRSRFARTAALGLVVAVAAACGGSSGATPSASASASASPVLPSPSESASTASPSASASAAPSASSATTNYVVRKGDNLTKIAAKFKVSLDALFKANPQVKDPGKLKVGDKLAIPAP